MIRTVEFRNFKALRHVKLDLERFTVLVGPNSSGKTSILEGLYYLAQPRNARTPIIEFVPKDLVVIWNRGAKGAIEISIEATEGLCKAVFTPPNLEPVSAGSNKSHRRLPNGWLSQFFLSTSGSHQWQSDAFLPLTNSASLLRLDAKQLASPSFSQEKEPRLGTDGQGLASALAYLLLNRRSDFDQLLRLFRLVCPHVLGIRFNRVNRGNQSEWGEELVFDFQGAPDIPAHMASDGTLLLLGLLAVIMGPDHPKLILLDDLDHGLHPRAQRDLVTLFRKLFEQDPELQIVATTHSPYLLDQLDPKEVRLTTRLDDGSVACARLDEHPDFEKWKEAMTPGEFWSMVGEAWVGERQVEAAGS
jgi:predicted ATPase